MKTEQPAYARSQILKDCGFDGLSESSTVDDLQEPLEKLRKAVAGRGRLEIRLLREAAIKRLKSLGCVSSPAGLVDDALNPETPAGRETAGSATAELSGSGIVLEKPKPWPEPVDGAELLDEIAETIRRFVVLPAHAAHAIALWCLWTYCYESMFYAPLLEITSPTKRCGKTTLLSVIAHMVCTPLPTSNISPAAVFRCIEKFKPCLLVDEADSFMRQDTDLRNVLNSGHTRSNAVVVRCAGDDHEPRRYNTFCPKAIALNGGLPSTVRDRSITVPLRRKTAGDEVQRFQQHLFERPARAFREKSMRWGKDHRSELENSQADTPERLNDRQRDNWFPLLAIADLADAHWPEQAWQSALLLSGTLDEGETEDSVQLLADLREIFGESASDGRMATEEIVRSLGQMDDRPWPEFKNGRPITARQLASMLKPFGIMPKTLRLPGKVLKGYEAKAFELSWQAYCKPSM